MEPVDPALGPGCHRRLTPHFLVLPTRGRRPDRASADDRLGTRDAGAKRTRRSATGGDPGRDAATRPQWPPRAAGTPRQPPTRSGPRPGGRTQRRRRGAITGRHGRPPAPARARITKGAGRAGTQRGEPTRARWPPEAAGTPSPAPWKGQRHEIRRTTIARAARSRPHPVESAPPGHGRDATAARGARTMSTR